MTSTVSAPTPAATITEAAVHSFDGCDDARLRQIMRSLVRHLHAFANDVQLTSDEWTAAIGVLTTTGQLSDDKRQEFILWSDTLGLSMLVDALEHPAASPSGVPAQRETNSNGAREHARTSSNAVTESTVLGPFWTPNAPLREYGQAIYEVESGTPALVYGRVLDPSGAPIAGALLDIWQNGDNGLYTVQDAEAPEDHLRGRFLSRDDGSYAFVGVRPVPYTIPHDGPVGEMIAATNRHPWRPAHIHMIVTAPGYRRLQTHIFDGRSQYLDSDAVFAVKPSLIRDFVERPADDPARPASVTGRWCSVTNDIVLAPL